MRYVILRDDDTNAFTPAECLDRLYRPFLERGFPVNLAVIPDVAARATTPEGSPEGFLNGGGAASTPTRPIGCNQELVSYLRERPLFHVLQHGCHHDPFEFGTDNRAELSRRIARGAACLLEAGLPKPETFVAPHDRFSRVAFEQVGKSFRVISTGWFELGRLPRAWWPRYVIKKLRRASHWRVGGTVLLSHPGCLLSFRWPAHEIARRIETAVEQNQLTVLVTHWWEYFREGKPDEPFIAALHGTAEYLADRGIKVLAFRDVIEGAVPLN